MNDTLLVHPLDLDLDLSDDGTLDLFAEELPEQMNYWSDCASTASTIASAGGCVGSFFCVGSIISCQKTN